MGISYRREGGVDQAEGGGERQFAGERVCNDQRAGYSGGGEGGGGAVGRERKR